MNKIEDCVAGVAEFNVLAGNLEDITQEKLLSQARVVREEGNELYDAVFYEEGQEQILKEAVDVLVTIHGFVGMLQNLGYDVYRAWKEVNDNNMSKFPSDHTSARYSAFEYESAQTPHSDSQLHGCYSRFGAHMLGHQFGGQYQFPAHEDKASLYHRFQRIEDQTLTCV